MESEITLKLEQDGLVEMETEDSILTIRFRKFFGSEKEFHFELNAKGDDGRNTKKTALKKVRAFVDEGFKLVQENEKL